jgi:hypothetical protein
VPLLAKGAAQDVRDRRIVLDDEHPTGLFIAGKHQRQG